MILVKIQPKLGNFFKKRVLGKRINTNGFNVLCPFIPTCFIKSLRQIKLNNFRPNQAHILDLLET